MKSPFGRLVVSSRGRAAFTLIELLAVMTIILVLAGLIINIASSAQYNSAKGRATSEIAAIATALENYKTDNGAYPPDPFVPTDPTQAPTGLLDPQNDFDPTSSKYTKNSQYLYQVLAGFPVTINNPNPPASKMSTVYMKFTPQQLKGATASDTPTPTSAAMYVIDPFGFSYGYSTIYAATVAYNNAQNPPITTPITVGYNPTFDLWSTAGYAPGGKTTPSNNPGGGSTASVYSTLWIKNW